MDNFGDPGGAPPTVSPFVTNGMTIEHRAPDTAWTPEIPAKVLPATISGTTLPQGILGTGTATPSILPVGFPVHPGSSDTGPHVPAFPVSLPQLPTFPRFNPGNPVATPPHVYGGPVVPPLSGPFTVPISAGPSQEIEAYFNQLGDTQNANLQAIETQVLTRIPAANTALRERIVNAFDRIKTLHIMG